MADEQIDQAPGGQFAAPEWSEIAEDFGRRFPDLDPAQMRKRYEQARTMAAARLAAAEHPPEQSLRLMASAVPFVDTMNAIDVAKSRSRLEAGNPEPLDYIRVARHEREQEDNSREQQGSWAGTLGHAAARLPGMAGEFAVGGAVLKGAAAAAPRALGWLAPAAAEGTAVAVPKFLSSEGLKAAARAAVPGTLGEAAAGAGRAAALTAAVPSMYVDRWVEGNRQEGRDPLDVRGFPSAFGLGVIQTAVLNSANAFVGPAFPYKGARQAAGRVGLQAVSGPIAQGGADVAGSLADDVTGKSLGIGTRYGTVGQLLEGDVGGAIRGATVQALTFAAFGLAHEAGGGRRPTRAEGEYTNEVMAAYQRAADSLARKGLSREAAGKLLQGPAEVIARLHEANPDVGRHEARHAMRDLPEGPVREYGEAVANSLPVVPVSEAPAAEAPERPQEPAPAGGAPQEAPQPGEPPEPAQGRSRRLPEERIPEVFGDLSDRPPPEGPTGEEAPAPAEQPEGKREWFGRPAGEGAEAPQPDTSGPGALPEGVSERTPEKQQALAEEADAHRQRQEQLAGQQEELNAPITDAERARVRDRLLGGSQETGEEPSGGHPVYTSPDGLPAPLRDLGNSVMRRLNAGEDATMADLFRGINRERTGRGFPKLKVSQVTEALDEMVRGGLLEKHTFGEGEDPIYVPREAPGEVTPEAVEQARKEFEESINADVRRARRRGRGEAPVQRDVERDLQKAGEVPPPEAAAGAGEGAGGPGGAEVERPAGEPAEAGGGVSKPGLYDAAREADFAPSRGEPVEEGTPSNAALRAQAKRFEENLRGAIGRSGLPADTPSSDPRMLEVMMRELEKFPDLIPHLTEGLQGRQAARAADMNPQAKAEAQAGPDAAEQVRRQEQARLAERDLRQMAAEQARYDLPPGTAGSMQNPLLNRLAEHWMERLAREFKDFGNQMREMSGQMAPRTTKADREAGEYLTRMNAAPGHAQIAAPEMIDKVLGQNVTEAQRRVWGATFGEMRLRHMREAYQRQAQEGSREAAAGRAAGDEEAARRGAAKATEAMNAAREVGTFVGKEGSPLANEAEFEAIRTSRGFQEMLGRWREHMVPEMEDSFRRAQGMEDDDPINSVTQIPGLPINLKRMAEGEAPTPGTVFMGQGRGNLKNTQLNRLAFSRKATGSADAYEADLAKVIEHSLATSYKNAAKAEAVRKLVEKGLATWDRPGQRAEINGERAVEVPNVRPPRGTQEAVPGEHSLYVDQRVYDEFRRAIQVDEPGKIPLVTPVLSALNFVQMQSTLDAMVHSSNQMTFLMKAGVHPRDLVNNALGVITKSPETTARLVELARIGAMKPGEAAPTGVSRLNPIEWMRQFLDVTGKVMRLTADDTFDRMVRSGKYTDTETNRRDYVNQLGQYIGPAQSRIVRFLRDSGLGPFATAGSNYWFQSQRALTMGHGAETTSPAAEVQSRAQMLGKVVAIASSVGLANYLAWGRIDGDEKTPFLGLKVGEDPDTGRTSFVDVGSLIGVNRGLRQVGALGLTQSAWHGGDEPAPGQGKVSAAVRDVINGVVHPAFGPGPQTLLIAGTGYDTQGRRVAQKAKPGEEQALKNFVAALMNANPAVSAYYGADHPGQEVPADERAWKLAGRYGLKFRYEKGHKYPKAAE